jgi:hypothetical protein
MSLENVKVGDWLKVQVTEIIPGLDYPIKCGEVEFNMDGEYITGEGQDAFPMEEQDPQGKWMMVSNDLKNWSKRKVLMEKNGKFLYWVMAGTDEDLEEAMDLGVAEYAKEVEEVEEPIDLNGNPIQAEDELTLDQWAEKLKPYLKPRKQ